MTEDAHDRFMRGGNHAPPIPKKELLENQVNERKMAGFRAAILSGHGVSYREYLSLTAEDANLFWEVLKKSGKIKQ